VLASLGQVEITSEFPSDQRRTPTALERYQILCDYSPDAVVIVDGAGAILQVNAQAEALFGYAQSELVGQPVEVLVSPAARGAHRRERERYAMHPRVRRMGARRDLSGLRKDGSSFPVEINLSPLDVDGGRVFCTAIRDISDRAIIEAALRESEERFRTLVDQASDGIFITDARGRYQDVNPAGCEMLGYTRQDLLGLSIADIVAPAERSRIAKEMARFADGIAVKSEWQFLRKNGSTFFGEVNARQLSDTRLLANVRDISTRRNMEDELRASKRFIEAVAKASPPVIYVFDLDQSRMTYANREILRDLEYPEAVWNVDRLEDLKAFMPHDELDHLGRVVREWRSLASGQVRDDEYCLLDSDGSRHWYIGRETVFSRHADGRVHQVLGTLYDITARKHIEQSLANSQALLQSFVEHTPAAVAMLDKDLRYIAVSKRWLQDYDLGDRDLTGRHHYDVFPEIRNMAEWQRLHQRALNGAVERRDEDPFVRADGHTDWLRWEMRPWRDEKGAIGGVIMFTEVITERKLTEAKLRESQMHLLASQHVARVGSWELDLVSLTDLDRNPLRWSDECFRVYGYEPGEIEVTSEAFWRRVHPDDKPRIAQAMRQAIATGSTYAIDHRIVLDESIERTVHQQAERVLDAATGEPIKLIGTVQDITDRLRLEDQLRQSQKMQAIGQLAGGVAHDFNNLLTVINGHSDMLLERLKPGDSIREDLIAIRDAGERAALLTRQLLLFSRKAVLEPRVLDCNDLIQRTNRMLRRLISEEVALSTVLAPSLRLIKADASQIEQVIMNLSLNACDAMPHGGRLSIETKNASFDVEYCRAHPEYSVGSFVQLAVSDTGSGLTPQVRAHLFEPFFTTKGPGRGTGLGLATVYGIVQESGGFITVSSDVSVGTTFNVFLPALEVGAVGAFESAGYGPLRGRETVLLVEDDPGVRDITRLILEKYGYTVLEATDGATALRVSRAHPGPIEILVSDVVMPEMSGRRLADMLLRERGRCRVLFMSGYNEEVLAGRGPQEGVEGFIQKPFSPTALVAKVRELLDRPD
jgi:two-component system cell cycle sensor histidine kinase/response regulator CckA